MSETLILVLIIVLVLAIVSEYGIDGAIRAVMAGVALLLVARAFVPGCTSCNDVAEKFNPLPSSGHVNTGVQIPDRFLDERRVNQQAINETKRWERRHAISNLFGPPAVLEAERVDKPMSKDAMKYFSMASGEYGRDHQYMDEDTDLAFAVESARRGRMMKEQLANNIKATPDTWKDIYEPELRAAEESTMLRI